MKDRILRMLQISLLTAILVGCVVMSLMLFSLKKEVEKVEKKMSIFSTTVEAYQTLVAPKEFTAQ